MAYRIEFLSSTAIEDNLRAKVWNYLQVRMKKEGKFKAQLGHDKNGKSITIKKVRLLKAKPYCGNHPGECPIGPPKRKMVFLEWLDWIAFNRFVNRVLNRFHINADVSSDVDNGKMYIRRGKKWRKFWDWNESPGETMKNGRPIRRINLGTENQF